MSMFVKRTIVVAEDLMLVSHKTLYLFVEGVYVPPVFILRFVMFYIVTFTPKGQCYLKSHILVERVHLSFMG